MTDAASINQAPHPRWAVAVVHPRQHLRAIQDLIQNGFEFFFPQVKRTIRHKGKRVHRLDPLLGVYVLVLLHDSWESIQDAWHGVLSLERIAGLLMAGDKPSYVGERELNELKSRCTPEGIYVLPPKPRFQPGQRVRVGSGPAFGVVGKFVRVIDKRSEEPRAKISLASLGEADVKISDLVAV